MIKEHFLKLFRYDRHANLQILDSIFEANEPQNAVNLMAHLLVAQQTWLSRCENRPEPCVPLWPDGQAVRCKYIIEENYHAWASFLENLNESDLTDQCNYANSKGERFQNSLMDILTHLINHGTHHRAQIGQQLKQARLEILPATDYIFFIRQQNR